MKQTAQTSDRPDSRMVGDVSSRSPSFQFYPDKWDSHTRHLSDYAYRIYHRLLNWMWLQSQDYCSCPNDAGAIAVFLAEPCERIASALQEIQNPHMSLLKVDGDRLVSRGLFKESAKQTERRSKASIAANKRWGNELNNGNANASSEQCKRHANASSEQCTPSPSPSSNISPPYSPPKGESASRRFQKPTSQEVTEYSKSIGFDLDGEQFCDFYEARGWKIGKTGMKDWRAAVRTWKKRRNDECAGTPARSPRIQVSPRINA